MPLKNRIDFSQCLKFKSLVSNLFSYHCLRLYYKLLLLFCGLQYGVKIKGITSYDPELAQATPEFGENFTYKKEKNPFLESKEYFTI